ncbi:MAG: PilZ domain-containing protein [Pseudobdellovibrio sp.]
MNSNWALYNALKFWTLYNLTETEVKLLLLTFSDHELKLAKVCRHGDSNWDFVLAGANAALLLSEEDKNKYLEHDGYPHVELKGESVTDTAFYRMKGKRILQPRLHNRYEKRIPCVINIADDKVFKTETIDLSEGGLYFKDLIPEWIAGYFIVSVNDEFNLLCSIVEDQKEKTRVQIVAADTDAQYVHYKQWLQTL